MATGTTLEKQTGREVAPHELTRRAPYYRPPVDIVETEDELRVLADMPGTTPENIDIRFENSTLTIHGKVEPRQRDDVEFLTREFGIGDFYRVFEVSEAIDPERISADYDDGVLVLHLPKAEAAKARRIEVRARK